MPATQRDPHQARKVTLGGAVLAALVASSCCIGPLILAALGIGGAGAFAVLGAYRPYILAVTALLLAAGFYLTYRKPATAAGDACGCEAPRPKAGKAGKIGLWIATALVVLFAAAPSVIAAVARRGDQVRAAPTMANVATTPPTPAARAVIRVEGMDCEACLVHLRAAMNKVGGVREATIDLKAHALTVSYEPAPQRVQAYVAAINELGYEASLPAPTGATP